MYCGIYTSFRCAKGEILRLREQFRGSDSEDTLQGLGSNTPHMKHCELICIATTDSSLQGSRPAPE